MIGTFAVTDSRLPLDERLAVFHSTVDNGAWLVQVQQDPDNGYRGWLCIYKRDGDSWAPHHQEETNISYGAPFGPDVSDVAMWQNIGLRVIDSSS